MSSNGEVCKTGAELKERCAMIEGRIDRIADNLAENTEAMRNLLNNLQDYPVVRDRVNNLWKWITGGVIAAGGLSAIVQQIVK